MNFCTIKKTWRYFAQSSLVFSKQDWKKNNFRKRPSPPLACLFNNCNYIHVNLRTKSKSGLLFSPKKHKRNFSNSWLMETLWQYFKINNNYNQILIFLRVIKVRKVAKKTRIWIFFRLKLKNWNFSNSWLNGNSLTIF